MPSPLRIALVVDPIAALIGAGRHPLDLAAALGRRGHDVRLFGLPPEWLSGEATPAGARVERRLGPSVLSFEPDGLVAYDSRSPAAWLGARVARRRRIPMVLVESDGWSERHWFQRSLRALGERLWGRLVRRAATLAVALDPVVRSAAIERGFMAERVALVPAGIDVAQFRPGLPSEELARRHIRGRILACRLPREADPAHQALIHAFARTVGQREDWSLVFFGEGEATVELRANADRQGIGTRVHFVAAGEPDLASLLSSSTLFAAPSDRRSALPDVQRALACGVPVLALDTPRLNHCVRSDENGLLVPRDDFESWLAALRDAASSPERRKRWGRTARAIAVERFGWDAVAARFELPLRNGSAPESANGSELPAPMSRA
jgi:glycosyltransferase involved in cell wall biosynthesis